MTTTLESLTEKEITFLSDLDKRCHHLMSSGRPTLYIESYHNVKLSLEEMERILDITKRVENIVFMPIQGSFGFHPAYALVSFPSSLPGLEKDPELRDYLLKFDNSQLPPDYDFAKLKEHFCGEENLRRANFSGMKFETEEHNYTY